MHSPVTHVLNSSTDRKWLHVYNMELLNKLSGITLMINLIISILIYDFLYLIR